MKRLTQLANIGALAIRSMKRTTCIKSLWLLSAMLLACPAYGQGALDLVSRTLIKENGDRAKISVFPGKAGYESHPNVTPTNSGTFGDGTVTDYQFYTSDGNNIMVYADGGAGLIDSTATGPTFVAGSQAWSQLWDVTDPGDPLFSTSPDLDPARWSGGADVTGTIDISTLSGAGSLYFMHGTFINQWSITVTMIDDDAILPDIVASDAQTSNGPGTNFGWVSEFKFCDAAGYETIEYLYFNADRDGSRARFMGLVIDEDTSPPAIVAQVPEHDSTTVFAGANISFTFDEDFDTTTGNLTIVDLDNTTNTVISIDDTTQVSIVDRTIIIDPAVNLLFETNYAVQIDAGIFSDCASPPNVFAGIIDTTTWNFTTLAEDATPPVITAFSPDVDTTTVPGADLVATFDEFLQAGTGNIVLRNLTGNIDTTIDILDASQVLIVGNILTISPTNPLAGGVDYAVRIDAGAVQNLTSLPHAGILDDVTWTFSTYAETTLIANGNWVGGNWDPVEPSLGLNATIDSTVAVTAIGSVTPWSGTLTLNQDAQLTIQASGGSNDPDMAFDGATEFFLNDGSVIIDNFKTTTFPQDWNITGTAGMDSTSNAGNNHNRTFNGTISGGNWFTDGRNHQGYTYNAANSFTSYDVGSTESQRHGVAFNAPGAAGLGDVTVTSTSGDQSAVLILGSGDVFSTTCVLTLNGKGWNGSTGGFGPYSGGPWVGTSVRIDMGSNNSTVMQLFIDNVEQPAGDYTGADAAWISGTGILTVLTGAADLTPPTVVSIDDDVSATIFEGSTVTYTVTFSEAIDATTIDGSDFEDGGTSGATIGSVSATGDPAVFVVVVTPTVAGDLILQVAMDAEIKDLFDNALDTSAAIPDLDTIPVIAAPDLVSELGVLSFVANGGINPNTGELWQAGDVYRLAFYTNGTIDAQSDDPADYDAFATAQAGLAGLGGSWTAMVWVNTDETLPQGTSPLSSPVDRSGTGDFTGGAGIGGAGVPVYAMDGSTCIARNNADIYNSWSNPFDGDATIRINTGNLNSSPHYSPFLDQFGGGDSGVVHGANVWTGGFGSSSNPLGNSVDPDSQVRASYGSSNANRTGRVWNRFQSATTSSLSVYAISGVLTVSSGAGDPLILKIAENGGNLDFEWNSLPGMQYDLLSSTSLDPGATTWALYNDGTMTYEDLPATGLSTTLTGVLKVGPDRYFAVREEEVPPLFEADFEAGDGNFDTTTTAGSSWEHGTPDSASPGGTVTEGNGGSSNCWGTLLGDFSGTTADPGQYADSTVTFLRSTVIDLTGIAAAELCFAEALDLEAGDTAVVNIIDDTTDTVIAAAIYTATDPSNSDAAWNTANGGVPITIPAAALGQPIRIEWSFTGFGGSTDDYLGWYIDDISVNEISP